MCNTHYSRWRQGKDLLAPVATKNAPALCTIDGCGNPYNSSGYCSAHYSRFNKYGDPLGGPKCEACGVVMHGQGKRKYCSDECRPSCIVQGCDSPARRYGRCGSHANAYKAHGVDKVSLKKWIDRPDTCPVCGSEEFDRGFRKACSNTCSARLWRREKYGVPWSVPCSRCGDLIDRLDVSGRRMIRVEVAMCRHCKNARARRYSLSASQLAERDGLECSICGDLVDLTLKYPDLFRASVDHVLARANGGTDYPENLALAHLWCNQVKNRFKDVDLRIPS